MFEVEHHKTDQNRLSQRGDGTSNDDLHGPHNQEVQATIERLLEHQQQSDKWKWNPGKPREVGCVAENNTIVITNHDSIKETYKDIDFNLFKGPCKQDVLSLPSSLIRIPRSDGGDRSIPMPDLPHLRPNIRIPESQILLGAFPLLGTLRIAGRALWCSGKTTPSRSHMAQQRERLQTLQPLDVHFATHVERYWTFIYQHATRAKFHIIRLLIRRESRCILQKCYRTRHGVAKLLRRCTST